MELNELSTLSETFYEDEEAALKALPRNAEGLAKLLSHLDAFDSLTAWCFLFEEYEKLMSKEQYSKLTERALTIFDHSTLSALLPDVFAEEDEVDVPCDHFDSEPPLSSEMRDYFMDA